MDFVLTLSAHPVARYAVLAFTGIFAGFLNSVAGGGSLLTLPVLIFLGLPGATYANGTNRLAIMIQNIAGVAGFRRKGVSDFGYGISVTIPAMLGAAVGALLVIKLGKIDKSGVIFNRALSGIMIAVLAITLFNPLRRFQSEIENLSRPRKVIARLFFFILGIYMGFIQAGVGFMIIATLTTVNGFDLVRTNALKMLVVLFCTLVALVIFIRQGYVIWGLGIALGLGNAGGAWIGSHWAVEKGDQRIRVVLVCAVLAFSGHLMWKSFFPTVTNSKDYKPLLSSIYYRPKTPKSCELLYPPELHLITYPLAILTC